MKALNHIGIAVRSVEEAAKMYQDALGYTYLSSEYVPSQQVRVIFLKTPNGKLELLEGTSETSPITKYVEKRGEGVHHLAFEVDNLEKELQRLKEEGFQLIHEKPVEGASGKRIAFVHPKSTAGVLWELCEVNSER